MNEMRVELKPIGDNTGQFCGFVYFRGKKFPDRELHAADSFTKEFFKAHLLPNGQALFRLINDNSKTTPVVMIDRLRNKLHFMTDYDDEKSGWDRGHAVDRLIVYGELDELTKQFDSVENILMRD